MYSFSKFVTKDFIIKSDDDRTVQGVVTAEIVDKQGEITIRNHLLKAIKKYMKNSNRSMSDTHTNRVVGQWDKAYPVDIIDLEDNKIAGIVVEGHIFKGTKMYDDIWNKIKARIYRGLSFGGSTNSDRVPVTQKDGMIAYQLKDLDVYEIAICQEPAVPWAIVTSFNQLAKAYSSKEIRDMKVFEKDNDQVVIQCDNNVCYVNQTTDTILDYEAVDTVMLKSSQERNLTKDMSKEVTKEDEKDEKDDKKEEKAEDSKDDKKDEKDESEKTKQDDKKDEDDKDDKDEEKSDIESLKEIIGKLAKTVHISIKQDQTWKKDIRAEIDKMNKALETPAPAEEHSAGDDVKLGNEYNDDPKPSARASEDPKEADSDAEDDDINMEEKSKDVKKSEKDVKKTPYPSTGQDIQLDELLKNTEGSMVLKEARESGDLGKIALLINKGHFGKVQQLPIGYPQVAI